MKKAGIACSALGIIGFLILSFKTGVIGYYASEEAFITFAAIVVIALIIVGVVLIKLGAAQDKREAERALKDRYQKNQKNK